MANRSPAGTRQVWSDRIDRFEQAGQTVARFCAAEGVSQASFYQWRRKLRHEAPVKQQLPGFLPVKLQGGRQPQHATVMSVDLPGGVCIRFEVTAGSQAIS